MDRDCEVAGPSRPRKRSRMQLGSDEIPMALFDEDTDLSSLSDSDTYQKGWQQTSPKVPSCVQEVGRKPGKKSFNVVCSLQNTFVC